MVQIAQPDFIDRVLDKHLGDLAIANQQIGTLKAQFQENCIFNGISGSEWSVRSASQETDRGSRTQRFGMSSNTCSTSCLEALPKIVEKLTHNVQAVLRSQSENELQVNCLVKEMAQTRRDLLLQNEDESCKHSESSMSLEAAYRGLTRELAQTKQFLNVNIEGEGRRVPECLMNLEAANREAELAKCKSDNITAKEEISGLKRKLKEAKTCLTLSNHKIQGLEVDLVRQVDCERRKVYESHRSLEATNKGLETELAKSKRDNIAAKEDICGLTMKLSEANANLDTANMKIEGLEGELATSSDALQEANEQIWGLEEELECWVKCESRKFSESQMDLEAANKSLGKDLVRSNKDLIMAKKSIGGLKKKLRNSRKNLILANQRIEGDSEKFSSAQMKLEATNQALEMELTINRNEIAIGQEEITDLKSKLSEANTNLSNANILIEGEQKRFSESHMNLEAANKGLDLELSKSKNDISLGKKEIAGLKIKLNEATNNLANANNKIEGETKKFSKAQMNLETANRGLEKELTKSRSDISAAKKEVAGLKIKLSEANFYLMKSNTKIEGLEVELTTSKGDIGDANKQIWDLVKELTETNRSLHLKNEAFKWTSKGNVEKIYIGKEWHVLGDFRGFPMKQTDMALVKTAMQVCKTWPKLLRFEQTNLDCSFASNIAEVINRHPLGFEKMLFCDEPGLTNRGLGAIVESLKKSSLQNLKSIDLNCALSGEGGGQVIHGLLEKCGNHLEWLRLTGGRGIGKATLSAAFSPFQDSTRQIKIDELHLLNCGVSNEELGFLLRNCRVTFCYNYV
eukprot:Platyproteum_vivax@DN5283_c0_g1_i4.p1